MSKLIVYFGDNPECIEGFSASCSRSVQGALHIKPRKPTTVTDDEYQHILASRIDLKGKIRVVADKPDEKLAAKAEGAPTEAQAEAGVQVEKSEAPKDVVADEAAKQGKKFK